MNDYPISLKKFISSKENRIWILCTFLIAILYFIALGFLYPVPSYYSDSFTWVGAAKTGQPVTMRPIGYSKVIMFFKFFSNSDSLLIAAQHFSNIIINLFLFFTCTYLFSLRKSFKIVLFGLLILNPFYVFYSNYISSDAFFNCLAVFWFILLIWILYKPSWLLIITQIIILGCLFELRYNAIFFPAISALALVLTKAPIFKKITGIGISLVLIGVIVFTTSYVTKKFAGTQTFAAFSGWQLANNAMHVIRHDSIDTTKIKDKEVKAFLRFTLHFFDTTKQTFPDTAATAFFMWYFNSPLKKYMHVFPRRSRSYFKTWNALGPVYNRFGKEVIFQKPITYLQHFVIPNTKAYLFPPLEIYETYMENRDTIPRVVMSYYQYKNNKAPPHHPTIYSIVFKPMQYLFISANFIFILLGIYYFSSGKYRKELILYNYTFVCFAAFYIANFFFIILLAPSVFRYHIFILTLSFPILLYLIQQLLFPPGKVKVTQIMV